MIGVFILDLEKISVDILSILFDPLVVTGVALFSVSMILSILKRMFFDYSYSSGSKEQDKFDDYEQFNKK